MKVGTREHAAAVDQLLWGFLGVLLEHDVDRVAELPAELYLELTKRHRWSPLNSEIARAWAAGKVCPNLNQAHPARNEDWFLFLTFEGAMSIAEYMAASARAASKLSSPSLLNSKM